MAFGIKRDELNAWKNKVADGEIAFLTHYWLDPRFPNCKTVTKVGCRDIDRLIKWGEKYHLQSEWIHQYNNYPHFDLLGPKQKEILIKEHQWHQLKRFNIN